MIYLSLLLATSLYLSSSYVTSCLHTGRWSSGLCAQVSVYSELIGDEIFPSPKLSFPPKMLTHVISCIINTKFHPPNLSHPPIFAGLEWTLAQMYFNRKFTVNILGAVELKLFHLKSFVVTDQTEKLNFYSANDLRYTMSNLYAINN